MENLDQQLRAGFAQLNNGNIDEALEIANEVLKKNPNDAYAYLLRGNCSANSGNIEKSIKEYETSLKINPELKEAMIPLALALKRTGRIMEAVSIYKNLWDMDRTNVDALMNMGELLHLISATEEAKHAVQLALKINPDLSSAYVLLARIARDSNAGVEEAVGHCLKAIEVNPHDVNAYNEMGNYYLSAGDAVSACIAYKKTVELSGPETSPGYSNWLYGLHFLDEISPRKLFENHLGWQKRLVNFIQQLDRFTFENLPSPDKKLKVGFTSGDLCKHSVFNFLNGLFENYDRTKFEFICFSNRNKGLEDEASGILKSYLDSWHVIEGMKLPEVYNTIRGCGLDILIDLSGHTGRNILPIYLFRAAPVQVTWLGYPDTTGLDSMDYRIVDSVTDPKPWADELASERLYRLPAPFLCYRPAQENFNVYPDIQTQPEKIVFGTFNEASKFSPSVIRLWCEILKQIPQAELVLKCRPLGEAKTKEFVLGNLAKYGIEEDRVRLLEFIPSNSGHMSSYNSMDVALDTFPYNGTTTSCEALWMGVPFITKEGNRHSSRVGMTILKAIGMEDWITKSDKEYVAKAVEVANNIDQLMEIKRTLRTRMQNSPLCDHVGFTRKFEAALRQMWKSWCEDKVHDLKIRCNNQG